MLTWQRIGHDEFLAESEHGIYHVRRVNSGSRVPSQRYRWRALWAPLSGTVRELALEKRLGWSKGAAEAHHRRSSNEHV